MHERDLHAARRIELARRFFSHAAEGAEQEMIEMLAPDAELEPLAADGRAYSGPEGMREYLSDLRGQGIDARLHAHRFDDVEGQVVVTGSLRRRSPGGMDERTAAWVLRFDDECRIRCIDAFGTRVAAYRAVGLEEDP